MSENKNMNSDDSVYIRIVEKFDKHAGGAPKGKSSHGFSEAFIDTPRELVRALMQELGLESLLTLTIDREVKRHDHLEVWG